ncbi:MAG: heme biosynthesis protein HemY [Tepidiforma sp.]|jgi:iron-sulfur cluster assembly protein|uniref:Iron-sulfur cluster assembly protein n=1 Tax=Tepidiforma thermophila (strain KCTC 52669 / CGMCC 1.13589 / G233) TaxID=2761530 RepID=A0A2A9HHW2_TEPT2|nr:MULTISPECIES: iron-sulfur cluster insertion protein ErpA [Tepidiforma]PFG74546.1 iron-sulfur cluster assembly protein [Tepidiforma thermophila]GIW15581.1 MAG: heme biosynthesis protein HemY [Tepidiforma sp.]
MSVEPGASVALVNITERAAEKARALLEARELPNGALRVFVAGGGCSGYQYGMALARSSEEDDIVIEQYGVRILVDPESARYLEGAEIDYVDDIMKSGFSIYNPNAVKSCACGSSFQTADGSGQPRACC